MENKTQKWLDEQMAAYKSNPVKTLLELLDSTTDSISLYMASEKSAASQGLITNVVVYNNLLLSAIAIECMKTEVNKSSTPDNEAKGN